MQTQSQCFRNAAVAFESFSSENQGFDPNTVNDTAFITKMNAIEPNITFQAWANAAGVGGQHRQHRRFIAGRADGTSTSPGA